MCLQPHASGIWCGWDARFGFFFLAGPGGLPRFFLALPLSSPSSPSESLREGEVASSSEGSPLEGEGDMWPNMVGNAAGGKAMRRSRVRGKDAA